MQINSQNFLRWFTNTVSDQTIKIPRLAARQLKCYQPVLAIGEDFAFYINALIPFDDDDFDNLRLDLISASGTITTDVADLVKDEFTAGYKIYCNGNMPVITPGSYQFRIYNTVASTIKCISNSFSLMAMEIAELLTVSLKYRNSRDRSGFRFITNPAFYNKIRIHLTVVDWEDEGNFVQYREVSTGTLRNEKEEVDRVVKVNTYYFDDAAHDAMLGMCPMDDIEINGVKYRAKGIYDPNARGENNLSKGEVTFYDVEYSKINKYGLLN